MTAKNKENLGDLADLKIAVLIPCHNEEVTIGKVIDDFRVQLPGAVIYVFDNCSTDKTAAIAKEHKAEVIKECRKGKGFVVESMLDCINADVYVMVDGDDTYPADDARRRDRRQRGDPANGLAALKVHRNQSSILSGQEVAPQTQQLPHVSRTQGSTAPGCHPPRLCPEFPHCPLLGSLAM